METKTRHRIVVDDRPLADRIGARLRAARLRAGLTQQQLAEGRYTKAYVSALENGVSKPSMAAIHFFAGRLGMPVERLLRDERATWSRLAADLHLASGEMQQAADAYTELLDGTTDRATRAELMLGLAESLCRLDRGGDAIAAASEASETLRALGRPADAALSTYWLSCAQLQHENPAEARALLLRLLEEVRGGLAVEPEFPLRILIALATVENHAGEHETARAYLEEARGLAADLDDRRRAVFLHAMAYGYFGTGDLEGAVRAGTQSLALFRAADFVTEAARMENDLALVYLGLGQAARAAELAFEARSAFERLQDGPWLARVIETQARIALARDDTDQALAFADQAIDLAAARDNPKTQAAALITRARALAASGRAEDAIATYEQAATLAREIGMHSRLRDALSGGAEALAALGRHAEAYELSRQALELEHDPT